MEKHYENVYMKRFMYFNLYVIKGDDGDILIDTGFVGMKRKLKKWLNQFNIKLVILTHAHVDHTWNVSYIKELYGCDVAMGINDIENIDNSKINSKPLKDSYKVWTKLMNWGMKKFIPKQYDIDMTLEDNQILNKYGIDLKILSLGGHTNGSIGILYKDYLFAGDALVNRGKHPTLAFQNQNPEEAVKSGKKIIKANPKIVFVGHDKEFTINNDIIYQLTN